MKTLKNIILSGIILFSFSSCSDWFEVEPENEIAKEDLFASYDGYRTALNGIYRNLSDAPLYGKNLSYGFISVLGQNYELPSWIIGSPEYYWLGNAINYTFDAENIKVITQPIWEKAFNTIANCNILIQNAEAQSTDFFYEGEMEKNLLIGEAKGIRALMHFDILRLFAPAPATGDDGAYIPYVSHYLTSHPQHLPTSVVLDSIINDLLQAKELLADFDTLYNVNMIQSVNNRFDGNYQSNGKYGQFFGYRGTRMNYVATLALLARVYQYKGDKEEAYQWARAAYEYMIKGWYSFSPESSINNTNPQYRQCKMYHDIILAFYNSNIYEIFKGFFSEFYTTNSACPIKNRVDLFGDDETDFRRRYLIHDLGYSLKWEEVTETNAAWYVQYQFQLLPVIRMSEVIYIMCEYLADTDLPRAIEMLNYVKLCRGATQIPTSTTRDAFLEYLYNDATREFLVEGQTFYLYKRLNRDMYNGEYPIAMDADKYVIPIPDSETNIQ